MWLHFFHNLPVGIVGHLFAVLLSLNSSLPPAKQSKLPLPLLAGKEFQPPAVFLTLGELGAVCQCLSCTGGEQNWAQESRCGLRSDEWKGIMDNLSPQSTSSAPVNTAQEAVQFIFCQENKSVGSFSAYCITIL